MMLSSFSFFPVEFETFHPDSIAETSNKFALHVVESELSMQTFYSLEERKYEIRLFSSCKVFLGCQVSGC
jgi:hypothetical protein